MDHHCGKRFGALLLFVYVLFLQKKQEGLSGCVLAPMANGDGPYDQIWHSMMNTVPSRAAVPNLFLCTMAWFNLTA